MKKNIYLSALLVGALAFASCSKEIIDNKVVEPAKEGFTLTANLNEITKTTADAAGKVSWLKADTLAVFVKNVSDQKYGSLMKFQPKDITKGLFETTSTLSLQEGEEYEWSAIYPYNSRYTSPANTSTYTKVGYKTQTQSATNNMAHVDGDMCPLVGYTQTTDEDGPVFEMKQASSLLKFNIKNEGTADIKVSKITFTTAGTKVAGTYYINFSDVNNLTYTSSGDSYTNSEIILTVTDGTIAAGATGAFYMVVCPTSLPAGATNTIVINSADGSTCTKEWTPTSAATLAPGKYKNINITYAKDATEAGAALPFEDDFSWANSPDTKYTVASAKSAGSPEYSDMSSVFGVEGGSLKFGTSSLAGSLTTGSLDLSSPFTVLLDIKRYSSDAGKVVVKVDGNEILSQAPESSTAFETVAVYCSTGYTASSKIIVSTSQKRAYIDNLRILSGNQYPAASATVTTGDPTGVSSTTGTTATFKGSYTPSFFTDATVLVAGFEYKLNSTTSWDGATSVDATLKNNSFTADITGLTANTQYNVRAWVTINGGSRIYGEVSTFTTSVSAGKTTKNKTFVFADYDGFADWGTGYEQHVLSYDECNVTLSSANHSTTTITDCPVTKGSAVTVVMQGDRTITEVVFTCKKWGTKAQTITLNTSTDGGSTYTATSTTSTNFVLTSTTIPTKTNALKFTFSSSSNQVGLVSVELTYEE